MRCWRPRRSWRGWRPSRRQRRRRRSRRRRRWIESRFGEEDTVRVGARVAPRGRPPKRRACGASLHEPLGTKEPVHFGAQVRRPQETRLRGVSTRAARGDRLWLYAFCSPKFAVEAGALASVAGGAVRVDADDERVLVAVVEDAADIQVVSGSIALLHQLLVLA